MTFSERPSQPCSPPTASERTRSGDCPPGEASVADRPPRHPRQGGRHRESCVVALLAGGHIIIEDYPGVGKTLLAKALARSVSCRFARIQFTPDLLPSDVTGVSVFNQKTAGFEFRPGPIFANIVLADEINRSSPEDAGQPAGMHGGAPGDDRQRCARDRRPVHDHRNSEPHRVRGYVPVARGSARPLHDAVEPRVSFTRRRRGDTGLADVR